MKNRVGLSCYGQVMICRLLLQLPVVTCFFVFPLLFPILLISILPGFVTVGAGVFFVSFFLSSDVHVLLSFGSICRCHADMESALTSIVANVVHFLGASSRTR